MHSFNERLNECTHSSVVNLRGQAGKYNYRTPKKPKEYIPNEEGWTRWHHWSTWCTGVIGQTHQNTTYPWLSKAWTKAAIKFLSQISFEHTVPVSLDLDTANPDTSRAKLQHMIIMGSVQECYQQPLVPQVWWLTGPTPSWIGWLIAAIHGVTPLPSKLRKWSAHGLFCVMTPHTKTLRLGFPLTKHPVK